MKVKYFEETDTLYVQLTDSEVIETKELNENIFIDVDAKGQVVSFTIEHVKATSGKLDFSYESVESG